MKLITKFLTLLTLLTVFSVFGMLHNAPNNTVSADSISDSINTDSKRIYSIVVDRFLNKNEDNDEGRDPDDDPNYPYGGDFEGIESELDYISDMGFDTLHLSPVFEHDAEDYLGYSVTNYDEVAESFGGAEGFQSLIDSVHELDMDVIVDMPMTATDEFEPLEGDIQANDLYQSYLDDKDLNMIDLENENNQELYEEKLQSFVDRFDVDGLTFMAAQDGLDAATFTPEDMPTYAITTTEEMNVDGFDYTAYEETRAELAEAFSGINKEIPELPQVTETEFLLADHWFSERFTSHAVEENMFPGTRVKQLMTYLYAYHGPISMFYGTEVALNGEDIPGTHQQMDLWTEQEVVEFIQNINRVFSDHKDALTGELETIYNQDGHYVTRYHTNDVDYILNVNNTSETNHIDISGEDIEDGKVLSGMLIGDMVRPDNDGGYTAVLDREETEFYAIVEEMGFNNGYIVASVIIFGGFAIFIFFAARNSKKKRREEQS